MNKDFELGRQYERTETAYMLHALQKVPDEMLRLFLESWQRDIGDFEVVIEETHVIL